MATDNWDYTHQEVDVKAPSANTASRTGDLFALKNKIHRDLMERIDLRILDEMDRKSVEKRVDEVVRELINQEKIPMNTGEKNLLATEILHEVLGLGPLEPLLADPSISDILVNTYRHVDVERYGVLEETNVRFQNDEHLMRIIERIASNVGRRIDESSPMVDARLPDGSRVNAIIPPLAVDGPSLCIRKFAVEPYTMADLIAFKTLTPGMGEFLNGAVRARVNILISGGTGSGKTTLLNVMSGYIPASERIITVEDSAELQLQQPRVVRLETRPPNIEGQGEVVQRDLVRNALRMRPDRIVVGEVRGSEALDMLQAMNTGHDGSLTTIHANSPRDALTRLEHMVGMSGVPIPTNVIRQQIAAAIHLIIEVERLSDGRRIITSIQEITGMEENVVNLQEIFTFVRKSVDGRGRVLGHFQATGIRPNILKRMNERGVGVSPDLFDPERIFE